MEKRMIAPEWNACYKLRINYCNIFCLLNFHERTVIGFEAQPPPIPTIVGGYAARHSAQSLTMNAHVRKWFALMFLIEENFINVNKAKLKLSLLINDHFI